ncbi:MAG: LysR substrate-binding domain-containing protein [Ramlibacter sp.]
MQIKWLEDLVALAQTRSFSRAAELRHVTHPAFGRRIRLLEQWAGAPLVERGGTPVVLTPAGHGLLAYAQQAVQAMAQARDDLRGLSARHEAVITLVTGRTLARTIAADWLLRVKPQLAQARVRVRTGSMVETLQRLEQGEAQFMLTYHHPLIAVRLSPGQYLQRTVARDRLVPVGRVNAQGKPVFAFNTRSATPFLAYADTLAMGRLVRDHLSNHAQAPLLREVIECDSADALLEYALKGLGVAWLPWSLAVGECKARRLATVGSKALEIGFEIRMVRPKRRLSPLAEELWQSIDPA